MPTRTFLKLNKDKQLRILQAAKKEFSRATIKNATITNIINNAGISRGSFYQYFDSIEDLFTYLLKYMYGRSQRKLRYYNQICNNDIFEAIKMKFVSELDRYSNPENVLFYVNTIESLYVHFESDIYTAFITTLEVKESIESEYLKKIFLNNENLNDISGFISFTEYVIVSKFIKKQITREEAIRTFENKIDFVKKALDAMKRCGY